VLARKPDVRFLVVGDGDQEAALRSQAHELGIASQVIFAGHRTDVPALLGALDVFCISSTYEGTPLTLFEAMAAGKTIVSTAVDGCREVLEDGATGLLVPPRDGASLAEALLRTLENAELRETLAAGARKASAGYDIQTCVDRMEALYDELLVEKERR